MDEPQVFSNRPAKTKSIFISAPRAWVGRSWNNFQFPTGFYALRVLSAVMVEFHVEMEVCSQGEIYYNTIYVQWIAYGLNFLLQFLCLQHVLTNNFSAILLIFAFAATNLV